jgi:peptidoglycan/LPS O-acetylase OafA/YrhL
VTNLDERPGAQSYSQFLKNPHFAGLDMLRGGSILLVIWHHVPALGAAWAGQALHQNGRHGVALFFVISGFLIASLLLREKRAAGKIALGHFYARRACRLFPLYYAILLVHVALVYGLHAYRPVNQALFQEKLPAYVFYYSNWLETAAAGPFFQTWSLAVEEQFYLVFALMILVLQPRAMLGVATAALVFKVAALGTLPAWETSSALGRALFSYQEPILLGVLLAYALHHPSAYRLMVRVLGFRWAVLGIAVPLAAALVLHVPERHTSWDAQVLYLGMAALVGACVVRRRVVFPSARAFAHLGKISYGVYLIHMLAISGLGQLGCRSPYFCFALTVALVVPTASLIYHYFERPIIGWARRRFSAAAPLKFPHAAISAPTAVSELA